MKLTCNQKIVLLLFIVAIVSVVFMEYTREYVDNVVKDNDVTPQSSPQPSALDHAKDAVQSGIHAVNAILK